MGGFLAFYGKYWLLLLVVFLVLYTWIKGNILGWRDLKDSYGKDMYPFSYRIFLGPNVYIKWAMRRSGMNIY